MRRLSMYIYALLRCLYIFTFGYLFKKNRKLVSNMCEILGYQKWRELVEPEIRTVIPEVEIASIVDDAAPLKLREAGWKDGNISLMELTAIVKLIRHYNPKKILEIGTFDGRTTLNLACNSPEDAVVYTLDLPKNKKGVAQDPLFAQDKSFVDKAVTGSRFRGTDCEKKITQLFGDSATFDFTPYKDKIDFIFIDGAHNYNYIFSDSEKALRLLRGGRGIILWHDYSWVWPDVTRALNKIYASDRRFKDIKHIKETSLVYYANIK